jgi:hypothetical protein
MILTKVKFKLPTEPPTTIYGLAMIDSLAPRQVPVIEIFATNPAATGVSCEKAGTTHTPRPRDVEPISDVEWERAWENV